MQNRLTIIISRTDSIGDVVLTLPLAGIIKQAIPDCRILFLGRNYTKDVIALSKYVDEIISYDYIENLPKNEQIKTFADLNATHILHVFPVREIAILAKHAKIKSRIGTANRIYHWFTCNIKIKLSRKNSNLHEAQLNTKLLEPLGIKKKFSIDEINAGYGFTQIPILEEQFSSLILKNKINVILHPKSKGSAREWGTENFSELILALDKSKFNIFITGTNSEGEMIRLFIKQHPDAIDLTGRLTLQQFIAFINKCDVLIASSTGPLHIAAALEKKAIGLFAPMRPIHPGRWKPIGLNAKFLVIDKTCSDCRKTQSCHCIKEIKVNSVIKLMADDAKFKR